MRWWNLIFYEAFGGLAAGNGLGFRCKSRPPAALQTSIAELILPESLLQKTARVGFVVLPPAPVYIIIEPLQMLPRDIDGRHLRKHRLGAIEIEQLADGRMQKRRQHIFHAAEIQLDGFLVFQGGLKDAIQSLALVEGKTLSSHFLQYFDVHGILRSKGPFSAARGIDIIIPQPPPAKGFNSCGFL